MENIFVVKGKDDIELSVKIIQSPMAGHLGANETYNRILTPFYRPNNISHLEEKVLTHDFYNKSLYKIHKNLIQP
jgi:hypothetical protein